MFLWLGIGLLIPYILWVFNEETVSESNVVDSIEILDKDNESSELNKEGFLEQNETINSNN